MSHEIYYTSAPEGLKRGTSGFCTVAASENIPRGLLERLETLSAYRHQFGVNAQDRPSQAGGDGKNPVSHAHWILNVANRTYHVLSRVCDSGVDHTQRTNAFAHHLVLENKEIEAAAGGPAWLLEQPQVMTDEWDGRVGPLSRGVDLPRGDVQGSRICREWEQATGDAGWGGHLADLFVKAPTRPVCILFSPGQQLLGLMAEAVALLPPAARWNVTFNTYFTSMPTSATCLWRCCLAGTPAAQLGLRYASGGLVLDLTRPDSISGGAGVPAGPYVAMARTGRAAAAATTPLRSTTIMPTAKAPVKGKTQIDIYDLADTDDEEKLLERQRAAVFETTPVTEAPLVRNQERATEPIHATGATSSITPAPEQASPAENVPPASVAIRGNPERPIRRAEEALLEAEAEASRAAQRRRRQVAWLFAGALGAIALGTGLVWMVYRNSSPPEIPSGPLVPPAKRDPIVKNPLLLPDIPSTPIRVPETTQVPVPVPQMAQSQPAFIAPVPMVRIFPDVIVLSTPIDRPNVGNGIGDRSQMFALQSADLDHPAAISGLRLHFPPHGPKTGATTPAPENTYASEALGTISGLTETRNSHPGVALKWKAGGDPGAAAEVAFISFDKKKPALELAWRSGILLKNPALLGFTYWILQNSTLELEGSRERSQRITFKSFEPGALSMNDAAIAIPWPVELPADTAVVPPRLLSLPQGWEASWYTAWEEKDAALRKPDNASQVLKFKKPTTSGAVDAWFLVTFKPGLSKVECNFPRRMESDQNDLARYESDLRVINEHVAENTINGKLQESPDAQAWFVKQQETAKLVDAYKAAIAAYNELTAFDVAFDLPEGLRLATLRFEQTGKAAHSIKTGM